MPESQNISASEEIYRLYAMVRAAISISENSDLIGHPTAWPVLYLLRQVEVLIPEIADAADRAELLQTSNIARPHLKAVAASEGRQ